MSTLGNILWIVFGGGIVIFLQYIVAGISLCVTIIGIPFGIQQIKLSLLGLVPFGKEIVDGPDAGGALLTVMNVIWFFLGGIWIALTHLLFAGLCALTVIGIPFALQHMKLFRLAIWPFGKVVREAQPLP